MFEKIKKFQLNENQMYLHEKKVEIPKLTPDRWKQLFQTVDQLPGLIVQVLLAPKEEFYSYVVSAFDLALNEVTQIVALLSGEDEEYIRKNVGLHEIIEFFQKTVQKNRLAETVKNLQSLLPKTKKEQ